MDEYEEEEDIGGGELIEGGDDEAEGGHLSNKTGSQLCLYHAMT